MKWSRRRISLEASTTSQNTKASTTSRSVKLCTTSRSCRKLWRWQQLQSNQFSILYHFSQEPTTRPVYIGTASLHSLCFLLHSSTCLFHIPNSSNTLDHPWAIYSVPSSTPLRFCSYIQPEIRAAIAKNGKYQQVSDRLLFDSTGQHSAVSSKYWRWAGGVTILLAALKLNLITS